MGWWKACISRNGCLGASNGLSLGEFDKSQSNLYLNPCLVSFNACFNLFYVFFAIIWKFSLSITFGRLDEKTGKNRAKMPKGACIGKCAKMGPAMHGAKIQACYWEALEVVFMIHLKYLVQITRFKARTCKRGQNEAKWRKPKFLPGGQLEDIISSCSELRLRQIRCHWKDISRHYNFYEELRSEFGLKWVKMMEK